MNRIRTIVPVGVGLTAVTLDDPNWQAIVDRISETGRGAARFELAIFIPDASPVEPRRHEGQIGGAVVGLVDVVDMHFAGTDCCPEARTTAVGTGPGIRHLVFGAARQLDRPVPSAGGNGLWRTLPAGVEAAVRGQAAA